MILRTAFSLLLLAAVPVAAHEIAAGPNGGKVIDVAGHHLELTHAPANVTIYATDESDKPIGTKGSTGRVVIQNAGKMQQASLAPVEPNRLVAKLDAPLGKGAVVVVSVTFGDGHAVQGRFTVD